MSHHANSIAPSHRRRSALALLLAIPIAVAGIFTGGAIGTAPSASAATTFVNETFSNANNWNVTAPAGGWSTNSPAGQYRNCSSAGVCDTTNVTRAWLGFASDTIGYIIESDLWIDGNAEECKIIYTNAHINEDYRVDVRRIANEVRVSGPAPSNTVTWTPSGGHTAISGSGAKYHLKVVVSRTQVGVYYKKATDPTSLSLIATLNTSILPDGKVGVGSFAGTCRFDNFTVNGDEGVGTNTARLLPVWGYERTEGCDEGPANPFKPGERLTEAQCDRPLFQPYNRDNPYWWDEQVESLDHANIGSILAHNRGCDTTNPSDMHGPGDMCPNQLSKLVTAITDRGSPLRVGMFDDLPTAGEQAFNELGVPFDWNNSAHWATYLWDKRWDRWFDTIPSNMWAEDSGRPIIALWSPCCNFVNPQGNISRAFDYLRARVLADYGADPYIIVQDSFLGFDTTLPGHIDAVYSWFLPETGVGTTTAATYGGVTGATIVPSFRHPGTAPGCGAACREVTRKHGNELIQNLFAQRNTDFVLLEGWTNVIESAGYYRTLEGNDPHSCTLATNHNLSEFPSQALRILKRFSNPGNSFTVLEAETADAYSSNGTGNPGGKYRMTNPTNGACGTGSSYNDLSVSKLGGTSKTYYVTNANSITFRDVYQPAGTYKIDVRYASASAVQICATANSAPASCVTAPSTGSSTTFSTIQVHAGIALNAGLINYTVSTSQPTVLSIDKVITHV